MYHFQWDTSFTKLYNAWRQKENWAVITWDNHIYANYSVILHGYLLIIFSITFYNKQLTVMIKTESSWLRSSCSCFWLNSALCFGGLSWKQKQQRQMRATSLKISAVFDILFHYYQQLSLTLIRVAQNVFQLIFQCLGVKLSCKNFCHAWLTYLPNPGLVRWK